MLSKRLGVAILSKFKK